MYKGKINNIKAIYSSPYLRCIHTAKIINKYFSVPIIEDERFNELAKDESWEQCQKRNMDAIDDIVNKYDNDDIIICVTSGVNFSVFVFYFTNILPSDDNPWIQTGTISPVNFNIKK